MLLGNSLLITGELEEHAEIFYWEPYENIREKGKKIEVGKSAMENSSTY
jgi:hypothetical protein